MGKMGEISGMSSKPEMLSERDVWGKTLVDLGAIYPEMLVLDGDLAQSTKADLFDAAYPDRFIECGIAEQNMAGMAAGLATMGFTPWLSSFAVFLVKRILDQVRMVIAQPNLNVKLGSHFSGLMTARTGKTHQAVEDLSVMRALPNMTVIAPAAAVEVGKAMYAIMQQHGPTYLRLTRDPTPVIFGASHDFVIGKSYVVRDGRDMTIVGTGVQTVRALEAAETLAAQGISAHVLHVPTLKPLDADGICRAAARTGLVLTTEEHTIIGGLGGAVAEVLGERCPTRMRRHGLMDVYGESGPNDALLEKYGLSSRHIAAAAVSLLDAARTPGRSN